MAHALSEKNLLELRDHLQHRYQSLVQIIRRNKEALIRHQQLKMAGRVHDTKDQSFAESIEEVDEAILDKHTAELQSVGKALKQIRLGSYSICQDCQEPIGYVRMTAYPTAQRCLRCQSAVEKRE